MQQFKWLFNLNPFTHLAVSYQEILFFHGPVRALRQWLLALGGASIGAVPRPATGSSIGCAIRLPRRYDERAHRARPTSRRSTAATAAGSSRR